MSNVVWFVDRRGARQRSWAARVTARCLYPLRGELGYGSPVEVGDIGDNGVPAAEYEALEQADVHLLLE